MKVENIKIVENICDILDETVQDESPSPIGN